MGKEKLIILTKLEILPTSGTSHFMCLCVCMHVPITLDNSHAIHMCWVDNWNVLCCAVLVDILGWRKVEVKVKEVFIA